MRSLLILCSLSLAFSVASAQWQQALGPTGGETRSVMCVRQPGLSDGSLLLAGSTNIFRSTDGGGSWSNIPNPRSHIGILSFVCVPSSDRRSDSLVFAGANGAFFRSTDHGATWDTVPGPINGAAITALLFIGRRTPTELDRLFAAASFGGVYRSSDNGETWVAVSSGLDVPRYEVLALAADTNFTRNGKIILFAGNPGINKVYSSTDFGDHWIPAGMGLPSTSINAMIVVDSCLYAGTGLGVYLSTNKGNTWNQAGAGMPTTSVNNFTLCNITGQPQLFAATDEGIFVTARGASTWTPLAFDPPTPRCFAMCTTGEQLVAGTDWGVYRSTLTWSSWSAANNGLTNLQATDIAILPPDDQNADLRMYASTYGGGVFRSPDRGTTWIPANEGLADTNVNCLFRDGTSLYAGTSGGGVFKFRPATSDWIVAHNGLPYTDIMFITRSGSRLFAAALGNGVFISTDDGGNWGAGNAGLDNLNVIALAAGDAGVFAGTSGGGVYRSTDAGTHWTQVNSGLNTLDIVRLQRDGPRLYAGTRGGGVYLSTNSGDSWVAINNGLTNLVIMSLYAFDMRLFAGTSNGQVFTSTNGGELWTLMGDFHTSSDVLAMTTNPAPSPNQTDLWACTFGTGVSHARSNWSGWIPVNSGLTNAPVCRITEKASATPASRMLFAASSGVHRSTDDGWTWTPVRSGLNSLWITSLAYTPVNRNGAPEMLIAGTTTGSVFRSMDDGMTWTPVHADIPNSGGYGVTALLFMQRPISGDGLDLLFAIPSGGIFLSTNAGDSWTSVNSGLPVRSGTGTIMAIFALASLDSVAFAATEVGVYRSLDRGRSWAKSNAGIPENTPIYGLQVVGSSIFALTRQIIPALYRSNDRGATWEELHVDLNTEVVISMAAKGGTLFLGTYRGQILLSSDLGTHWARIDAGFPPQDVQTLFVDAASPSVADRYLIAGTSSFHNTSGASVWRRPLAEVLPPVTIGPASISFGGVEIGSQKTDTVLVNNNSASPLVVGAAVQGVTYFHVSATSTSIQGGGTMRFAIAYQPTSQGNHNGIVVFSFGATGSPDTVHLYGTGMPTNILTITSVSPQSGAIGTNVTIVGTNFTPVPDSNIVRFGGVRAPVLSASASNIVSSVPPGAMYAPVTVTTRGRTASCTKPFVVTFASCGRIDSTSFSQFVQMPPDGRSPKRHGVGDLDGDGRLDIVIWDSDSSTISILRNVGSPGALSASSFSAPVYFTTGTQPGEVVLADLDCDGKLDIVAGPGPSVLRNTSTPGSIGPGSFATPFQLTGSGGEIEVADLDGDGKPDIASLWSGSVAVMMNLSSPGNLGPESFAPPVLFPAGGSGIDLSIGDLDGDGKPDIAVADGYHSGIMVLRNTCTRGSITPASFAPYVRFGVGSFTTKVAIVDVDGDSKPDLLANLYFEDCILALRNSGVTGEIASSSFTYCCAFGPTLWPRRMVPGDLDGDGKTDVIVVLTWVYPLYVQLLRNTSSPGNITASSFAVNPIVVGDSGQYHDLTMADLDGDGRPDLAIGTSPVETGGSIRLLRSRLGDTYVIRAGSDTNGIVIPSGDVSVLHGTSQTFAFGPNNGYRVDSVIVDGTPVDSIQSYTFRNVTSAHTIRVSFVCTTEAPLSRDVVPKRYELFQNYPNPCNPSAEIRYQIPKYGQVRIVLYDLIGREVATLVDEKKPPGVYSIAFEASALATGVYFYRMTAGSFIETKKLLLLK